MHVASRFMMSLFLSVLFLCQQASAEVSTETETLRSGNQFQSEMHDRAKGLVKQKLLKALDVYLWKNPDAVHHTYSDGETLLGYAAYLGDLDAVRYLIAKGADPNAGRDAMRRPLSMVNWAIEPGPPELASRNAELRTYLVIVDELLKSGADHRYIVYLVSNKSSTGVTFGEAMTINVCDVENVKNSEDGWKEWKSLVDRYLINKDYFSHFGVQFAVLRALGGGLDENCVMSSLIESAREWLSAHEKSKF